MRRVLRRTARGICAMEFAPFDPIGALRFLESKTLEFGNIMERLSSGMKINKAADNPSDLVILSGMNSRLSALRTAIQNVQDAISMYETQDGGMAEIADILVRIKELAVRAANDATLRDDCADRTRINNEVQELKDEIKNISLTTTFNGKQVLIGSPVEETLSENIEIVDIKGESPSWDSTGQNVYFTANNANSNRPDAYKEAWRIYSREAGGPVSTREMLTTDPDYPPLDKDGDGYLDHPLSDPDDNNPDLPANAADTDGDLWPDIIDPAPSDANWPANVQDNDGDGVMNYIDPDDADPSIPVENVVDNDGDGYIDHALMDPDDNNPSIPDYSHDTDGDGLPDYLDRNPDNPLYPLNPPDPDGDGVLGGQDYWPNDSDYPLNPPDTDGDGWPDDMDTDPNDPLVSPPGVPADTDGDGVLDFYDHLPNDPSAPIVPDTDGDGVFDHWDEGPSGENWVNDPLYPLNPQDGDGDGIPDLLDPQPAVVNPDSDGDGVPDIFDGAPADPAYPVSADADGDGYPDDANGWFDPDPGDPDIPALYFVDDDGDGWPAAVDTDDDNALIPGTGPLTDNDGDGFPSHPFFDPDDNDPAIPFDNSIDVDQDGYPDYIDGGPGDPAGDDNNPYLPLSAICYEDRDPDFGSGGVVFASNRNNPYDDAGQSWSAAGNWTSDIYILQDGVVTPLTNDYENFLLTGEVHKNEKPSWSDDGKSLTWIRDGDVYYMEISSCSGGSAGTPELIADAPADAGSPVFDPNSDTVYFSDGTGIYTSSPGGGGMQQLLDKAGNPIQGTDPTFSPDGDFLIYSKPDGTSWVFNTATREEMEMQGISADAGSISWSPSGDFLAYEVPNGASSMIMRAEVSIEYTPISVQVGVDSTDSSKMEVQLADARIGALGLGNISVASQDSAEDAIGVVDTALDRLGDMRTMAGKHMSVFRHILDDLHNQELDLAKAASTIGDADMAREASDLARTRILMDSTGSVLTQSSRLNRESILNIVSNRMHTNLF